MSSRVVYEVDSHLRWKPRLIDGVVAEAGTLVIKFDLAVLRSYTIADPRNHTSPSPSHAHVVAVAVVDAGFAFVESDKAKVVVIDVAKIVAAPDSISSIHSYSHNHHLLSC
jgi:hypothetical protein